jgi:hypothetical protein
MGNNRMTGSSVIQIGNVLVSSEIITEYFACDYPKCQGACCIIGDSGAPLLKEECETLEREFDSYSKFLRKEGIRSVKEQGPFVIDNDGDLVTPLIEREECAYTFFDDHGNCFCAIEKAHANSKRPFRKPVSCWLYPVRVSVLSNGMTALNLHKWHICADAFAKGEKEGIAVYRFVREALIFRFGEAFYEQLETVHRELFR